MACYTIFNGNVRTQNPTGRNPRVFLVFFCHLVAEKYNYTFVPFESGTTHLFTISYKDAERTASRATVRLWLQTSPKAEQD